MNRRQLSVLAGLGALAVLCGAAPAHGAVSCTFAAPTATIDLGSGDGEGGNDSFYNVKDGSLDKADGGAGTDSVGAKDSFDVLMAIP